MGMRNLPAQFETTEAFTGNRLTSLKVYISTNKRGTIKTSSKIVSGGERSRIILAMKSIFTKEQLVERLFLTKWIQVLADVWRRLLRRCTTFQNTQVLSITHLPQVASMADTHIHIESGRSNGAYDS